ncbi:hypothetical protein BDW22DRAFT_621457 [Trametopsis cervina]|nr:hypothetical protein BDW22DRAFT_621457 [Trametopsis cervina]
MTFHLTRDLSALSSNTSVHISCLRAEAVRPAVCSSIPQGCWEAGNYVDKRCHIISTPKYPRRPAPTAHSLLHNPCGRIYGVDPARLLQVLSGHGVNAGRQRTDRGVSGFQSDSKHSNSAYSDWARLLCALRIVQTPRPSLAVRAGSDQLVHRSSLPAAMSLGS